MPNTSNQKAVILVNLGTPAEPTEPAIRDYLRQFLSDTRVVNLPVWLWQPILRLIILKIRPRKLVAKYRLIWGKRDGPIRNITCALARRVQSLLPGAIVIPAMTYGQPSIADALGKLDGAGSVTLLPLFPQYAGATTGAVRDALERALEQRQDNRRIDVIDNYHADAGYINAVAGSIRQAKQFRDGRPYILFSFHGIPRSQAEDGDPYATQCQATASLVTANLGLSNDRWAVSYQSRFGPAAWLTPYTDKTVAGLPARNIRDLLIVCPGFSVDCLETLEEIKILNRKIFMASGGETFNYVRALNASLPHASLLADMLKNNPQR